MKTQTQYLVGVEEGEYSQCTLSYMSAMLSEVERKKTDRDRGYSIDLDRIGWELPPCPAFANIALGRPFGRKQAENPGMRGR